MKNRWLLNIALAIVVAILVLVAIYKPGARKEPESTPLTAVPADAVTRLRLLRPKQPDVVLERRDDAWWLTAPRHARANAFRVGELVRVAATPVKTRFAAAPQELAKYGLDRPVATLFLNDAEIRFGAMHPLHSELYVLHAGQVQLVPAATLRATSGPVEDLLSLNLLDNQTKIVALRLPGFSLRQNEQGAWARTPELKDLESDRINRFVDEWRFARALSVAPARTTTARERALITIADGARTRTLEFGIVARKPELVIVRRDEQLAYHFPADSAARLLELVPEKKEAAPAAGGQPAN